MTIDEQFEKLENTVREYNPGADFKRIRESYEFAKLHHGEQRRKSGELYITHPLAVAQIVAEELHLDSESIEAALLHDVIEDTDATYDDVAKLTSPTRQAEAEVSGYYGDLRPHRTPAGYAADEVGAGGSLLKISGPHRLR